jgi:hypothetical protein
MLRRAWTIGALLVALLGWGASGAGATTGPDGVCDGRWHVVPSADHSHQTGEYDLLNAVSALSSTDQWAVGSWELFPGNPRTLVEHFDGTAWTHVPSPDAPGFLESYLLGVAAFAPDDVWAVGGSDDFGAAYSTLVEHWDGTSWSIEQEATIDGFLKAAVALGPDDVWAVGSTNYTGPGLIEHWNGTTWTATYLPYSALLRGVTALGPNDIWAVGQLYNPSDPSGDLTLTLHFDGADWTRVPSPSPLKLHSSDQNWLTSVSAITADDVWAVGLTRDIDWGIPGRPLIEHWDGAAWSVVPSPDPPLWYENDLWGVAAIASNDVWAVGAHGLDPTMDPPLAEHWDGTRWRAVATASRGQLLGIAAEPSGPGVMAVGDRGTSTYVGTLAEHLCPA